MTVRNYPFQHRQQSANGANETRRPADCMKALGMGVQGERIFSS
jgi:hypothetical protein